jgi:hypothetical protein
MRIRAWLENCDGRCRIGPTRRRRNRGYPDDPQHDRNQGTDIQMRRCTHHSLHDLHGYLPKTNEHTPAWSGLRRTFECFLLATRSRVEKPCACTTRRTYPAMRRSECLSTTVNGGTKACARRCGRRIGQEKTGGPRGRPEGNAPEGMKRTDRIRTALAIARMTGISTRGGTEGMAACAVSKSQ